MVRSRSRWAVSMVPPRSSTETSSSGSPDVSVVTSTSRSTAWLSHRSSPAGTSPSRALPTKPPASNRATGPAARCRPVSFTNRTAWSGERPAVPSWNDARGASTSAIRMGTRTDSKRPTLTGSRTRYAKVAPVAAPSAIASTPPPAAKSKAADSIADRRGRR